MISRQGISLLILGAIHLTFLLVLTLHDPTSLGIQFATLASLVLLFIGYGRIPRSHSRLSAKDFIVLSIVIELSGILTYYVSIDLHLGPVIASAGIGFIASYLPKLAKFPFLSSLPAPIYCGTFVGMCCSTLLVKDYFFVAYSGIIAGLIYVSTRNVLNGIGGKLGTIAFGGVVIVAFIFGQL